MRLVDNVRLAREIPLEALPVVHVETEACPDEPTPTLPPPPTRTPTATATPTDLPTATATPRDNTIYLPIGVREECRLQRRHADVVLVIDLSTSMDRATRAGRPKLQAVLEAAQLFIDVMKLEPDENGDYDQVAIVGFNRDAWIAQPLTSSRADLSAALAAIPALVDEFTRLDLALDRGAEALRDAARRPASSPMMILLTDGLPNQVPYAEDGTMETTVLRSAQAAKADGTQLYTIGVGHTDSADPIDQINAVLLREVASDPSMFYQTPDAEEVKGIYAEVAVTFGCPPGRHDWTRPWP
jgi:Mg-chelatase subunit ChlD